MIHLLFLCVPMKVYTEIEPKIIKCCISNTERLLGWQHCEGQACLSTFVSPAGKRNLFYYYFLFLGSILDK